MHLKISKLFKIISVFAILVLFFTGCNSGKADSASNMVNTESNAEGTTDKNDAVNEKTEETESGQTEEVEDAKNALVGTNVIYDRKLTKGKMAVYYISARAIAEYCDTSLYYGDSSLIIAPDGTTMLIDIQNPACAPEVVATLEALGIDTIDYLVISHHHGDHIGGYKTLMRYIDVKNVYCNAFEDETNYLYRGFMSEIEKKKIPVTYLYEGDSFSFGGVDVEVFHPNKNFKFGADHESMNNGSVTMKMTYKKSTFMFAGDITTSIENELVQKYGSKLQADICKMNHHGNEDANGTGWVKTVSPKLAISEINMILSQKIMGRYQLIGATTLCTGVNDTVVVWTDGDGKYDVQVKTVTDNIYTALPEDAKDGHFVINK